MDLYAVRWPSGTYTVCAPANEPLPTVKQPALWVGQGSHDPANTDKTLSSGISVVGLTQWRQSIPGTILLRIPEPTSWERLEPPLKEWLSAVFQKEVNLQEVCAI